MNLKQIETFRWIARLGGFAAAAQRMSSTQSAVSIRIQELEQSLGVRLFDRGHRTTRLTAKGTELLVLADELMETISKMRTTVADPNAIEAVVKIGVADLVALTWLSDYVSIIRERYPKITLDLEIGLAIDLIEHLRHRELDVFLGPGEVSSPEFDVQSLGFVDFQWAASSKLGIPRRPLAPADLNEWPIITLSRDSYHYQTIEQWFRTGGSRCHRVIVCNSINVMLTLTMDGLGVGLLPLSAIDRQLNGNDLAILDTTPPIAPVEFFAITAHDQESPINTILTTIAGDVSTFNQLSSDCS